MSVASGRASASAVGTGTRRISTISAATVVAASRIRVDAPLAAEVGECPRVAPVSSRAEGAAATPAATTASEDQHHSAIQVTGSYVLTAGGCSEWLGCHEGRTAALAFAEAVIAPVGPATPQMIVIATGPTDDDDERLSY
jgi:hypothetical protein